MTVAKILKDKGNEVATVSPRSTLMEVARLLTDKGIGAVVICDTERCIAGIISERDIVRILAAKGPGIVDEAVNVHMTTTVKSCGVNDTVESLMETMTSQRFRHMPVVEDGQLAGIVSIRDVVKQRIATAEMDAASLREYIATGSREVRPSGYLSDIGSNAV